MRKRIQRKVAESRMALPLTTVYAALVCVAIGVVEQQMWVQAALLAVSTLLMVELNNAHSLIRIYSRMVSCSFLALMMMAAFLFPSITGAVVGLSFIIFYLFILRSYQDRQAMGYVYAAFLSLGVGSLFFVQLLYFVPLFWFLMATRLLCLGYRTFSASLLGLLTPYWFAGSYFLYVADYVTPLRHFQALGEFAQPFEYGLFGISHAVTLAFILILAVTGIIHSIRQRSHDRLRTQMLYIMFIDVTLFIMVFLVLQPQHYDYLLRLLIVNTSILIGHFLALTRTKVTNVAFLVIVAVTLLITAYNLAVVNSWILER